MKLWRVSLYLVATANAAAVCGSIASAAYTAHSAALFAQAASAFAAGDGAAGAELNTQADDFVKRASEVSSVQVRHTPKNKA